MRPHYAVYESNEEKAKKYDEVFKRRSRLCCGVKSIIARIGRL